MEFNSLIDFEILLAKENVEVRVLLGGDIDLI
jgi:hypothetical protein